jgi:hypothetical protein
MNEHRERSERELLEKVLCQQEEANDRLQGIQDSIDIETDVLRQILDAIGGQSVTPATGGTISQLK